MKLSDLLHAKRDYRDAGGTKLPGVTTILGVLDKAPLVPWAAKLERAYVVAALAAGTSPDNLGSLAFLRAKDPSRNEQAVTYARISAWLRDVPAHIGDTPQDVWDKAGAALDVFRAWWDSSGKDLGGLVFLRARDTAADLGTLTHARIEAWLQGVTLDPDGIPPDLWEKSAAGFARFRAWWTGNGLQLVASERAIVHEAYGFGGTLDIVAMTSGGDIWLVDIKTSNKTRSFPYPAMKAQVAAYERLWFLNDSEGGSFDSVVIVRVGKDDADDLDVHYITPGERIAGWRAFLGAREAYLALKEL